MERIPCNIVKMYWKRLRTRLITPKAVHSSDVNKIHKLYVPHKHLQIINAVNETIPCTMNERIRRNGLFDFKSQQNIDGPLPGIVRATCRMILAK